MKRNDLLMGKNMEEIGAIASETVSVLQSMDIYINRSEAIPVIAKAFLEVAIKKLVEKANEAGNNNGSVELDVFDLFTLGIDSNANDEDENNNNRVPFCRPLKAFKLAVKDDDAAGNEVDDMDLD